MRRNWYGGNSGYSGYSMSNRAVEAREEGRFPKTDFKKVYGIDDRTLDVFTDFGIIDNTEWHHTSKYGNKTNFYSWVDDDDIKIYEDNMDLVKSLIRRNRFIEIANLFNIQYDSYGTEDIQVGDHIILRDSRDNSEQEFYITDVLPNHIMGTLIYYYNGKRYEQQTRQQRFFYSQYNFTIIE